MIILTKTDGSSVLINPSCIILATEDDNTDLKIAEGHDLTVTEDIRTIFRKIQESYIYDPGDEDDDNEPWSKPWEPEDN